MVITTKEELHIVIDEMMTQLEEPQEIGICKSYIRLDENMYLTRKYKGIELTYYNELYAKGQILIS